MSISQKRVCIIGAGPSGMSMLFHFKRLKEEGKEIPEFVCYEKQNNWGGLWNYTWRTGLDDQGDAVHGSQYRFLYSNGPKEGLEFPDYTFEDHFGKPIASYPPRVVLFDYLCGRWTKHNLRPLVHFSHMVKEVKYNKATDNFTVLVKNKSEDKELPPETFDYVIVGTGHFSAPNMPSFPGIENFPGRVLHSHDLRDAREFKDKRVLLIGSRYSAEDICMQVVKYGAKNAIVSWRTQPLPFKYPAELITQRPLLLNIDGNTCHFKDGSTADVDAIIFCTGYLYSFNFLPDELRLRCDKNVLYPPDLYKLIVFLNGGNNKCLYMGMQDEYYSFTMLDAQARWITKYMIGDVKLPDRDTMVKDAAKWVERNENLKDTHEEIDFQTEYIADLVKEAGYGYDLDTADWFHKWKEDKMVNILTYRDQAFASKFTGNMSPPLPCTWMEAKDDSIKWFLSGQS